MPHPMERLVSEQDRTRDLAEELDTALWKLEQMQESFAQLELQREDVGWTRMVQDGQQDMSREGVIRHAEQHRVAAIADPLIRRGTLLTAAYVFGQGVGTRAEGDEVNAVVQGFLDDDVVRKVFTGAQAQERNQVALATDGNIFYALPTDPVTGAVTIRDIPLEEVVDIITDPQDRESVWFYVRRWQETDPETGRLVTRKTAYPQLRYSPATKHRRIRVSPSETVPVQWDTPVYHVAVNQLKGQLWGTADVFSAVPWARGYSEFLNDWARLMKALSRIAYRVSGKNASQSQQMRAQAAHLDQAPAGSTAVLTGDATMEPMPKTGATIDSESARPLATMVAAALGLPVTTLLSDPGQTGARAVAETLNLPTRLIMEARREVWRETRRQILEYVILQAVRAPRGELRRRGTVERAGDRLKTRFRDSGEGTLTIDFPPLDDTPTETIVEAVSKADATGTVPPLVTLELLLRALRVRDVDEILASVTDDDGNFVPPMATAGAAAGQSAADALRRGGNPADYL